MMRSSYGRSRFQNRLLNKKFNTKQDDISTCVPVLVELLKEKDTEIVKLRNEIDHVSVKNECK